ncbi:MULTISPECIES: hypothetical protein [unclassified Streptomyces]|uniref:hypothetical protein n=1 Tax=unclassified Streptomyces TaxID=2593676 RepID=UPI00087FD6F9|nr:MULTISPECIES: hypothetical protein [unclassified Streptomyces]PBC86619.1 hypothetical protein BX261_6719 [Streptomyces sp. 2321.6]SDQ78115.1 hypothetical protein SAMN05216511_0532 [Streptomyces sp. KS_16]SEE04134.1 hypothetical protein SAMN05428940_6744 [Streptomyces sp. 2133.1]SNC73726.1 hypothetical protein SAMN06272741_6648 [Streptomyces sp. 2114.4]
MNDEHRSEEHRSADDAASRAMPCDEERRLARKALAGRARDADDLSLLTDMLGLDPSRDPDHEAAHGRQPAPGRGTGRGTGRERRQELRRDTCRDARSRSGKPGA